MSSNRELGAQNHSGRQPGRQKGVGSGGEFFGDFHFNCIWSYCCELLRTERWNCRAWATGQNLIINSLVATALATQNTRICRRRNLCRMCRKKLGQLVAVGWRRCYPRAAPMIYAPGCLGNMPRVLGLVCAEAQKGFLLARPCSFVSQYPRIHFSMFD